MSSAATARVKIVPPGQTYAGGQGFTYSAGASLETVGARKICMNVLPMPAGKRAKVHSHKDIETIAFMLEGTCTVHYGERLEKAVLVKQGEQIYIPDDVPHAPSNESGKPCTWIVVHSSGSDQEGLVLMPDLDLALAAKLAVSA